MSELITDYGLKIIDYVENIDGTRYSNAVDYAYPIFKYKDYRNLYVHSISKNKYGSLSIKFKIDKKCFIKRIETTISTEYNTPFNFYLYGIDSNHRELLCSKSNVQRLYKFTDSINSSNKYNRFEIQLSMRTKYDSWSRFNFNYIHLYGENFEDDYKLLIKQNNNLYTINPKYYGGTLPSNLSNLHIFKIIKENEKLNEVLTKSDINTYASENIEDLKKSIDLFPQDSVVKAIMFKQSQEIS